MIEGDLDQHLLDIQRDYLTFLDDEEDEGFYLNQVKEMITEKTSRLVVNINDLRKKKPERAARLFKNGAEEIVAFQNALKEFVGSVDPTYEKDEFFIGFEGSFGSRHVNPRTLRANYMNNLVCLEGIVTRCSLVKAKLVKSVHYCPATDKRSERKYTDPFSLNHLGLASHVSAYPTKDIDGNLLETEYGLSVFKNQQIIVVQEMPEKAPRGQLPRAVEVVCDHDLADRCQLGDRVQIVGVYKCLPSAKNGYTTCVFRTVLAACHITVMSKNMKLMLSRDDLKLCKKLSKKPNIFDILSQSLAPSIHGHEYVKKGILCLLLGGVEKVLANGTRLRGDINILLIGDPSVAKSQLLRYVLTTAPRAIATTGRGCSGVGLTAAVSVDRDTGEKCLEAGAMVLADRGIVCIDEFDKMSDIDRTAIHEVMEQGRVSISKAGIQARLNARCSVLAAGNPLYGRYDPYRTPMENIGMQDSLLSRFDLIFVLLDSVNQDVDSMIADHVIRMLRYRDPNEQDGEVLPLSSTVDILTTKNLDEDEEEGELQVFEKYDPLLHGQSRKKSNILTIKFMKLYLSVAKTLKPILTDEASETLAEEYARLRSQEAIQDGQARTQPVTARTLETLIRLATGHAKARLSTKIEIKDAEAAIELVQFAYFKKVLEKERKRRKRDSDDESDADSDNPDESRKRRVRRRRESDDLSQVEDSHSLISHSEPPPSSSGEPMSLDETVDEGEITEERFQEFKKASATVWQELPVQSVNLDKMKKRINEISSASPFTSSEFKAATRRMSDDNQIMVCDNIVYLI